MVDSPAPDPRPVTGPGDGWVECRCGHRHWGRYGAAGLLLWQRRPGPTAHGRPASSGLADDEPADGGSTDGESTDGGSPAGGTDLDGYAVVLQHRALWSHHGGTWGLPGGAVGPGESEVQGALREASEEAGLPPSNVAVRAAYRLDHEDWAYTTVVAEAVGPVEPRVSDPESLDVRWVGGEELHSRPLLPAFAAALPSLRELVGRRLVLVVDGANTMGSRPDGWWRDRAGATVRLRDELAELAVTGLSAQRLGLPGHTWYPQVVLVAEGRARGVAGRPAAEGVGGVAVVDAPGSGDDEIVRQAERQGAAGGDVVVVTADRELRRRVEAAGARTAGPGLVLR